MKRKKILIGAIGLSIVAALFMPTVFAANPDTVNITVRIKQVGINCNESAWAVGWVDIGSTTYTTRGANFSNVSNTGNFQCDFHAVMENTSDWGLSASAGSDIFAFGLNTSGTNGSHNGEWHQFTDWSDNDTFATHIDPSSSINLGFSMAVPTSTTIDTEQSFTLTLSAVLSS